MMRYRFIQFVERGSSIAGVINRFPLPYSRWPVKVHGHRMFANSLDRFLALLFWKLHLLEGGESSLLSRFCKPGMSVVDLGANVGFYSLLFARWVGHEGHVWAFEPDLDNFSILQRNLLENGYCNISAINCAVSSFSGEGDLFRSGYHYGDHRIYQSDKGRESIPIRIVALDDFFSSDQRIDLMKMDIQGAEGKALEGMKRIIKSNPGLIIFMEFWPTGLLSCGSDPERVFMNLQEEFGLSRINPRTGELQELSNYPSLMKSLPGNNQVNLLATSKS